MNFNTISYTQLDSTNAEAIRLYRLKKITSATLITTREQTEGRGYATNLWESEPGKNLTFSYACFPHFIKPAGQFIITQIISLSLTEVVSEIIKSKKTTIKWPNDIYVNDKKIAGILIQNFVRGDSIDFSVIGTGLNVNQKKFTSDAPNPTSLSLETGKTFINEIILNKIMKRFNFYLDNLTSHSMRKTLKDSYLKNLYRLNQPAKFRDKNGIFTAVITGTDAYGQLILQNRKKEKLVYGFKEIEFL